jgi:hypothetical protein
MTELASEFAAAAGLPDGASYRQVIDAVHAMPYGRPAVRTPRGAVAEWRGTCSTKHALLAELVAHQWPQLRPRLVHRVYLVDRRAAAARFGAGVAAAVPAGGLTDVHRYLLISVAGADVVIDVTFPGDPRWDGAGSMALACGDGVDYPAGAGADREKADLEARFCDPVLREPFIAALARSAAADAPAARG